MEGIQDILKRSFAQSIQNSRNAPKHCEICGQALTTTIDYKGLQITVPVICKCQKKKMQLEQLEADKRRRMQRFKKLQKINPEIFGWIYIPDTNIDYPLLQSNERDDFYLHSDIYRNYKYAGSLYSEYCNSTDMDDRVTLIYGHNMIDGSMFANLHKFRDASFFNKHTKFYIYTPERRLTYQVVSAFEYDDRHIMNTFNFSEDKVFKEYLDTIQNPHSLSANVKTTLDHKLTVKDKIVTLSTCLDAGDGRYLLQGVLVKDEPTR